MKNIYITLLALILFNACTKDEDNISYNNQISFKVEVAEPRTKLATDENFNVKFESGDVIGVFIYKRNTGTPIANAELYANNVKLTYTGSQWVLENEITYPSGKDLDFYAYYPYTAGATDSNIKYNASEEMHDLLSAKKTGVKESPEPVRLQFEHLLALVDLNITKEEGSPNFDGNLKAKMYSTIGATYNIFSGTVSSNIKGEIGMQLAITGTAARRYRVWIPEQTIPEKTKIFRIEQNTVGAVIDLEHKAAATINMKKGNVTRYKLVVEATFDPLHKYALYDPFPYKGTPIGVVVKIQNDGLSGQVMHLKNISLVRWSASPTLTNATSLNNGLENMLAVRKTANWKTKNPAFALTSDIGYGWYIPAIDDAILYLHTNVDVINNALAKYNGEAINKTHFYWSSTEYNQSFARVVRISSGAHTNPDSKMNTHSVRAILNF